MLARSVQIDLLAAQYLAISLFPLSAATTILLLHVVSVSYPPCNYWNKTWSTRFAISANVPASWETIQTRPVSGVNIDTDQAQQSQLVQ
jgi:hypothetical protein